MHADCCNRHVGNVVRVLPDQAKTLGIGRASVYRLLEGRNRNPDWRTRIL